jgi:SAM-dependent methyltransferase
MRCPPMAERTTSFAQEHTPSIVDRSGRWLSTVRMRRYLGDVAGRRAADIGCGYDAALAVDLFRGAASALLVDVAVDPALATDGRTVRCGQLPGVLADVPAASLDAIICNNVIEHLHRPEQTLAELHRLLAPGGVCIVNVPSWRGKVFLELAAFRLGVAPKAEMDDHKAYYDPHDLWPMLVAAGFLPSEIKVTRHKGGLNTIARCRTPR